MYSIYLITYTKFMLPVSILVEGVVSTAMVQHTFKQLINNLKFSKHKRATEYTRMDCKIMSSFPVRGLAGRHTHALIAKLMNSLPILGLAGRH